MDFLKITVIIPALNEQESIAQVIKDLNSVSADQGSLLEIIVVDNGSTDKTKIVANEAGAKVVSENQKGYGRACLAGIAKASKDSNAYLFIDADGSDLGSEWPLLADALIQNQLDFVLGSRVLKSANSGLLFHQKLGNHLAAYYLRKRYQQKVTDLAPFRLIRKSAYEKLNMQDENFGWTIEMQIKAARKGIKTAEVAVSNQKRIAGRSKISGTICGTFLASKIILGYILKDLCQKKN